MKPLPQENRALADNPAATPCRYVEPEQTAYRHIRDLQLELVSARRDGRIDRDVLLLVEHPPVFTLGRRGGRENLCVAESFLNEQGIDVVHIERGGDITYHGPGQLVGYPICRLAGSRLSVVAYVSKLEAVMIRTAAQFGVKARTDGRNRGAWVGDNKLGSIGIAVRRGIAFHGFALNVNTDLTPFGWINPCGLKGVGVTSLAREIGSAVPMAEARSAVRRHVASELNFQLETLSFAELKQCLRKKR